MQNIVFFAKPGTKEPAISSSFLSPKGKITPLNVCLSSAFKGRALSANEESICPTGPTAGKN